MYDQVQRLLHHPADGEVRLRAGAQLEQVVALPQVHPGQHPTQMCVGDQVLRHLRKAVPESAEALLAVCIASRKSSSAPASMTSSVQCSPGPRSQLWDVGLHPVPLELPVGAVVHHQVEGVVHHLQLTHRNVVRPQAVQRAVDTASRSSGVIASTLCHISSYDPPEKRYSRAATSFDSAWGS